MRILGNRVLVSKVEEEKKSEFETAQVQDNFVYKGRVEVGSFVLHGGSVNEGDVVLFAKYSPDTQEIEHEGKKMKIVKVEDIIAVL